MKGYFCLVVPRFNFGEEAFWFFGDLYKAGIPEEIFILNPPPKINRCVPGLKMVWFEGGSTLQIRAKFLFFPGRALRLLLGYASFLMRLSILRNGTPGMSYEKLPLSFHYPRRLSRTSGRTLLLQSCCE